MKTNTGRSIDSEGGSSVPESIVQVFENQCSGSGAQVEANQRCRDWQTWIWRTLFRRKQQLSSESCSARQSRDRLSETGGAVT